MKTDFKIVVIDDNEELSRNLQDIFETQGYRVAVAGDGQTALRIHEEAAYDLALVDINLPDTTGNDLIDELRTLTYNDEYFIIMTGYASLESAIDSVGRQNLIAYVTKPLDVDNLLVLINQVRQRRETEIALKESEERFHLMVNSMEDIVFTIDTNMMHTGVYGPWVDKFGFPPDYFVGKSPVEIFGEKDAQVHIEANTKALKGEFVIYDWEITTDKGKQYYQSSLSPMRDDNHEIVGIVGIGRNITERKEAEELFRTITESSPVGIYIVQQGRFVFTNPQFQKDTGYDEAELNGKQCLELVLPEERETVKKNAIDMLNGISTIPYEYKTVNKSGEIRWSRETVKRILFRGSRATIGSYQDITEQKKMQENLIVTDRLASVGELAAGIAHELNNPITGIIGFSDLLMARTDLPEEVREDLEIINKESVRASQVARHLLMFARKHTDEKAPVNVNDIIKKTLELRSYEQKVNNIETSFVSDPDLPIVLANDFQLQQVFLNIIINAEHFMIEEHGGGSLGIVSEQIGDSVVISISDTGPGITKNNLAHIFDPFFTTKEIGKGTGLGLSICYGIIMEHGGTIDTISEVGKGTTFRILIPVCEELNQEE